ncbi:MAG: twin-arginine translocation pathway signal [Bradyrhizobium sp.]|uniref:twin-arginine translocation pathway signal n=1 Tax=Bradyrhizobium sp. TaxID=376 RepID=UPI001C294044|nr:twin-arginine translocation pathway signal [Bradyrhizobium sp.]MBU6463360.1 twin-arginine translocation pathway signal [Pseudomonadota bacterium]MDE2066810.1 twin-arginine translocation pathway signal [Bradyrhizobium sp.]MDE2244060.1 twin-arginine translocation pathway signal [Bradyrhizobium sp.]MDE2467881.1 twin-arginine translocation pathway signal [Bradyrhizobium sp.]
MFAWMSHRKALPHAAIVTALLALGIGLSGCAGGVSDISLDSATLAFVDPARYDFYDCKQLQIERKSIAGHIEDTRKLMDKADTGFAGPVVAEMAYRNDYISFLGQKKLADQTWKRNNCHEVPLDPPGAAPAAVAAAPAKGKKGNHGPSRPEARSAD